MQAGNIKNAKKSAKNGVFGNPSASEETGGFCMRSEKGEKIAFF
jgi:hypothetical protein